MRAPRTARARAAADPAGCWRGTRIEASRDAAESFGSKSANTFSCVSSVCATCHVRRRSGPSQKNDRAPATRSTSVDVDALGAEDVELGFAEVVADDADDADVREEARREGEVRRGAAEDALALPNGVSSASNATEPTTVTAIAQTVSAPRTARPAACRSASALSVRSQVKSASSRPKCP